MKEQDSIPASKVQRATRMLRTGAKVGVNYAKHAVKKAFNPELDRSELDQANAEDIYETLSELKGGALKVAQMLSMDKGVLPKQFAQQFVNAQYSAPPLSGPLVVKTFRDHFGKTPQELFDTFGLNAVAAASIGQVHRATKDGKDLAVKVQYPGVRDSIKSDLKMVKMIAPRIMGVKGPEVDHYFDEVEERLMEETDYALELKRSIEISTACAHIPNLVFPTYHAELSGERVLTMGWLDGLHMTEFLATNPSQEVRNSIGQALWDFTLFQMHKLGKVHADPHPGNFLCRPDGTVGILDFGCVKEIPSDFYRKYFTVIRPEVRQDPELILRVADGLDLLHPTDTEEARKTLLDILTRFLDLVHIPFFSDTFNFGDDAYLEKLYTFGMEVGKMEYVRDSKVARGSRHALYINRVYYGLFSLLNQLKAEIRSRDPYVAQLEILL
jgi:predicted unusual protein kinase regulating ubiquinone biosynthesis (AarF/ABC1/UbiB family)